MSDAGKKVKSRKAQGWEEAGGEFYQENYSTDWDGFRLPTNSLAIATLLPSKQNRFATNRRTRNGAHDFNTTNKYWQSFASTTHTQTQTQTQTNKQNESQFSILPDLSQVHTDEERIWEEMLQIKLMPVSMQKKKDLKLKLQSATKLRLQGINQFKWKHRKVWQKIGLRWTELITRLELWKSSLKQIEGHFGTGVVAYFLFLRWLFFLNCAAFLVILVFIVAPNVMLKQQDAAGSCGAKMNASKCVPDLATNNSISILDVVQGAGVLKNSLMFYGTYSNQSLEGFGHLQQNKMAAGYHNRNKSADAQQPSAASFYYDLPLAYIFANVGYFSIALVAIVRAATREFKDRLINGKWQFYQYCNLVFGGWDFCIHNEKSGKIKHRAVYNEIKCLLQSRRIEMERNNRSKDYMYKLIVTRIIVNIAVLTILTLSAYIIYLLFNLSLQHQNIGHVHVHAPTTVQPDVDVNWAADNSANGNFTLFNDEGEDADISEEADEAPADVTQLLGVTDSNPIDPEEFVDVSQQVLNLFIEFVPYIAIVGLNLFLPIIFNYLCNFENYSPLFVVKISLFRTVFLRLASLAVLLSRFYYVVLPQSHNGATNSSSAIGHTHSRAYSCWETFVGQQFYKLIITDFVSHLLVTFCINFPRAFFARNIKHRFVRFIGEQEFELPKHVLDVVYLQTICWLGSFYTPVLPALVAAITFCMFYVKKFQCLVNSRPSKILYGASRSNSLFMLVLLLSYFISMVPIIYAIAEVVPSPTCGPFAGLHSVWDAPVGAFMQMPALFKNFIFFFGTAGFVLPCFVLLTLLLYYFYAVSDANKNMVEVLKNQLVLEGHDKQFLLTRLSEFLKQHQEDKDNTSQMY